MNNCPECQPSTLTVHGEKTLRAEFKEARDEIEQLRRVMTISRDLCIFLRDTKVCFDSPGLVELEQAIKAVTAKDTD